MNRAYVARWRLVHRIFRSSRRRKGYCIHRANPKLSFRPSFLRRFLVVVVGKQYCTADANGAEIFRKVLSIYPIRSYGDGIRMYSRGRCQLDGREHEKLCSGRWETDFSTTLSLGKMQGMIKQEWEDGCLVVMRTVKHIACQFSIMGNGLRS